jgi:hypothetical protein
MTANAVIRIPAARMGSDIEKKEKMVAAANATRMSAVIVQYSTVLGLSKRNDDEETEKILDFVCCTVTGVTGDEMR